MDYSVYSTATGLILRPTEDGNNEPEHMNALWSHLGPDEDIWPGEALPDDQWRIDLETRLPVPHVPEKSRADRIADVRREERRRMNEGIVHNFGDERGALQIRLGEPDRLEWQRADRLASARVALGQPEAILEFEVDGRLIAVRADEWLNVQVVIAEFEMATTKASRRLQEMETLPDDVTAAELWAVS